MDWKLETVVVPVSDVDRAKAFYAGAVGFHVDVGPSADRADYETFLSFSDPDGNGWMIQEVPSRPS